MPQRKAPADVTDFHRWAGAVKEYSTRISRIYTDMKGSVSSVQSVGDFYPLHDCTQKAEAMAVSTVTMRLMTVFSVSFFMTG